jgi:2-hydroxychromene-2-carboxylate isomerase
MTPRDPETPLLEVFFDCSSPWTYLGFHNIQPIAERLDVPITWRPIIVGGVFNQVNMPVYEMRANPVPAKADYSMKDMMDWARFSGLTINFPPKCGHPVNAVKCMRACIVMQSRGKLVPFATAAFERLWEDGLDLALDEVLSKICVAVDEDPAEILALIATPELKQKLRDNTDELIARGGFGSPTMYIDRDDMFFGNDRLLLVEDALRRKLENSVSSS